MAEDFEFKTRRQFFSLIEKKDRWRLIQAEEVPRKRFEQLLGPQWALDNWALDENAVHSNLGRKSCLKIAGRRH